MHALLDQCRWPDLPDPYDAALREAAAFILKRFDALGILASGTIVRGQPDPSSDLDVYVVQVQSQRQRIQKFFHGVPAEIFVNPVRSIEGYLKSEQKAARPLTAHMLATGFVVLDRDPVVAQLRERARTLLANPPALTESDATFLRYMAATQLEDALDIAATNPAGANLILGLAVHSMLRYACRKAGRFLPRDKDLLDQLELIEPDLARPARAFWETGDIARRAALAQAIADRAIETRGFFEWQSELEDVPERGANVAKDKDTPTIEPQVHRRLAVDLFNAVWSLLDKPERSVEEDDLMIHAAHASRYHWGQVGAPVNLARGEWQVSRVYAVLKRPEPALYHARRSLEICQANDIGDFDLAYAYEALARASAIAGQRDDRDKYVALARAAGEHIAEEDDRAVFDGDMATIP